MTTDDTPWMRLLRELFGDDAERALEELERMGLDPKQIAEASGLAQSPEMMDHVLGQIRSLMTQSQGEDVNWTLAHDVARGVAAQGGDPTVSAATASDYRQSVSRAELWLDAATDFDPSREEPHVWSRAQWVEATLPTWRVLAGPVAVSVSSALSSVLHAESEGTMGGLLGSVPPTVCGMHMGQAAGQAALEVFGGTDLGIPLLPQPRVALVPSVIEGFSAGLDVPAKEVQDYLALREAAHVRLFAAAPWLPGQLHAAIERYAAGITIDLDALDRAVSDAGAGDPAALQEALTRGIFASHHTDEQAATLEQIETWLALIEGWVDEVTTVAAAPHLPSIGSLREMMRRRRAAGGPAEDAFANLLGLDLRPRRLRDASAMWGSLTRSVGAAERDAIWSHPDLPPRPEQLANWQQWVDTRGASDDVDAELQRMLEGGLGDAPSESEPNDEPPTNTD
ncbi:zinc-dependent metalloprotease [Demequina sp.]|uniref:zinc-dependent metalloprotease n=1 Tax=Demequina sp. TaxID=2050685 RepID=UPI003D14A657